MCAQSPCPGQGGVWPGTAAGYAVICVHLPFSHILYPVYAGFHPSLLGSIFSGFFLTVAQLNTVHFYLNKSFRQTAEDRLIFQGLSSEGHPRSSLLLCALGHSVTTCQLAPGGGGREALPRTQARFRLRLPVGAASGCSLVHSREKDSQEVQLLGVIACKYSLVCIFLCSVFLYALRYIYTKIVGCVTLESEV